MNDLRRLRAFHAVAERGSFSAAAVDLGYAQSVVSHHVAALERELGLTLVNRATRPVSVTDGGERLNAPPAEGFTLPYRTMLERLCRDAGFEPNIAYVLRDVTVARAFVAAGLCISLMAELMVPEPHSDVAVRPLSQVDPFRSIYATWVTRRRVPSVAPMVRCLADA